MKLKYLTLEIQKQHKIKNDTNYCSFYLIHEYHSSISYNNYNETFESYPSPGLVGRGYWPGLACLASLAGLAGLAWLALACLGLPGFPGLLAWQGGFGGPGPLLVSGLSRNYLGTIQDLLEIMSGQLARPANVGARPANVEANPANVGARPET